MISDNDEAGEVKTQTNSYKCTVRLNNQLQRDSDHLQNCDTCFKARWELLAVPIFQSQVCVLDFVQLKDDLQGVPKRYRL